MSRPGEFIVGVDYGVGLSGDTEAWRGLSVTDRYGDSMAGMYMPPHVVQSGTARTSVGLPKGFALSATVPYILTQHVHPSGMPGDVDSQAFGDVGTTGSWSRVTKDMATSYGGSLGLTIPTGLVVADSPVRSGRGTFGTTVGLVAGHKLTPKVAVAGSVNGGGGFGADMSGYRVGPGATGAAGIRWSPRENGRVGLAAYGALVWQGRDRQDALVYKNTGFFSTDVAAGVGWMLWQQELRSLSLSARLQAPVWQVIGDPMYAENVSGALGISVVAL